MPRALWIAIVLCGCRQLAGLDDPLPGDGGPPDDDTMSTCWTYTTTNFDACDVGMPEAALDLSESDNENGYEFDTSNGRWSFRENTISGPAGTMVPQAGGSMVRIINVAGFDLGPSADLLIRGSSGLIVVVHGNATIDGSIRVEAGRGDDSICGDGNQGTSSTGGNGGAGGGGGGFGSDGADGGNGGGGLAAGTLGSGSGDGTASPLRGGCDGGTGGSKAGGGGGGLRGSGGGALQISVRDTLMVDGEIDARGRGGDGGEADAVAGGGGGGGGTGGTIFLESRQLAIASMGRVCANGGAGGEGGSTTQTGANGNDGSCSAVTGATTPDLTTGGDGGTGAFAGTLSVTGGVGTVTTSGGGGGGGAVGRVRIRGVETRTLAGTITPTATP